MSGNTAQPGIGTIAFVAVMTLVLATVFGYAAVAYYRASAARAYEERAVTPEYESLRLVIAEQESQLQAGGWADEEQGIARLPIEDAMSLVVAREAEGRGGGS